MSILRNLHLLVVVWMRCEWYRGPLSLFPHRKDWILLRNLAHLIAWPAFSAGPLYAQLDRSAHSATLYPKLRRATRWHAQSFSYLSRRTRWARPQIFYSDLIQKMVLHGQSAILFLAGGIPNLCPNHPLVIQRHYLWCVFQSYGWRDVCGHFLLTEAVEDVRLAGPSVAHQDHWG